MSAGDFNSTFYELDTGNGGGIAACRVQPETELCSINSVANAAPAGPATLPVSAKANKGNREYGIGMRRVSLEWTGDPPEGYSGDDVIIPVLQEATYAAWTKGQTGTYLGEGVQVKNRFPENVR